MATTIKEHIDAAIAALGAFAARGDDDEADREFALAIVRLEDAKTRATRGIAMRAGLFEELDLQKPEDVARLLDDFERRYGDEMPPPDGDGPDAPPPRVRLT